jgi:hypothetical protein
MGTMQVRVVRLRDYLDVEVTGPLDVPQLLALVPRLGTVTREHGDKRLMFDLQGIEGVAHVSSQMRMGEQIVQHLAHLESVASVVPPDKITRASENVARGGGVRMKVFGSKDVAIAWLRATEPPPDIGPTQMEPPHAAIWEAVRHLFPQHAQAIQLTNGTLAISWAVKHETGARHEMATPISVRLEPALEASLREADPEQRKYIATQQEATFRAGLMGYDPYAAVPSARVIVLG